MKYKTKKNNVEKVFEELKQKRLINKKRKIKSNRFITNFKSGAFSNKLFYNPSYSNINKTSLKFILLHEEGHKSKKSRSVPIFFLSVLSSFFACFIFIQLNLLFFPVNLIPALVFFLIIFLHIPYFKEDEFDADLWAALKLREGYKIKKPSEIIIKSFNEMDKIKPKLLFPLNYIISFLFILIPYHPSDEERINYIREVLE